MAIPERFAVIADVHGNAIALEAVLADVARRGTRMIVNLGDNANGPLEPARCVELLRSRVTVNVRGNGDRGVADAETSLRSAKFARERLDQAAIAWLGELPRVHEGDGWTAFHAAPENDEEYLLEEVSAGGVTLREAAAVAERLRGVRGELLLCGHTHVPRAVRLGDARLVVNPGSVGLPGYSVANPFPHKMENGSPHARYAIVERGAAGW
ncbi:MAG TPA: metallophosphoesterase family protein, partial [Opitutus sp.]|nr:metallophosphoesterase family protein [Opitutus sp.]